MNRNLSIATIALILLLCFAAFSAAQYSEYMPEYDEDGNSESSSTDFYDSTDSENYDNEQEENPNPLFFVRNFRKARNWFREQGRRIANAGRRATSAVGNFGRGVGNRIADQGKKAGKFFVRNGKIAGKAIVNTGKNIGNKLKDFFVPNIPKTGITKASSNGPNYGRSRINSIHEAVRAYTPIVWLHKDEKWFPTSAEKLANWKKVDAYQIRDKDFILPLTSHHGQKFDPTAPVYVNVKKGEKGQFLITYAFLYHYNDCGPHVRVWASASFLKVHERIYPCPIGIHWGDIEHVTIHVDPNTFRVTDVTYAYHAFDETVKPNQVEWEGTRPVFYSAKGSHATYLTPVDQQYVKVWDERTSGAATFCYLEDYPGKGYKWIPNARWLAVGGAINEAESRTPLSDSERSFMEFQGYIGPQIKSAKADKIKNSLYAITSPIRKLKSSWDKAISAQIVSLDKELQPTSIGSIATKSWFSADKNAW